MNNIQSDPLDCSQSASFVLCTPPPYTPCIICTKKNFTNMLQLLAKTCTTFWLCFILFYSFFFCVTNFEFVTENQMFFPLERERERERGGYALRFGLSKLYFLRIRLKRVLDSLRAASSSASAL